MFDKKITLGNIIQIIVLCLGILGAYFSIDNRVTNLEKFEKNFDDFLKTHKEFLANYERTKIDIFSKTSQLDSKNNLIRVRVDYLEKDTTRRLESIEQKIDQILDREREKSKSN